MRRKVRSLLGLRSRIRFRACFARRLRCTPYSVASLPYDMVLRTIWQAPEPPSFSSLKVTMRRPFTDLFFWMRAILSSTSLCTQCVSKRNWRARGTTLRATKLMRGGVPLSETYHYLLILINNSSLIPDSLTLPSACNFTCATTQQMHSSLSPPRVPDPDALFYTATLQAPTAITRAVKC